jgi:hypothetical protein
LSIGKQMHSGITPTANSGTSIQAAVE